MYLSDLCVVLGGNSCPNGPSSQSSKYISEEFCYRPQVSIVGFYRRVCLHSGFVELPHLSAAIFDPPGGNGHSLVVMDTIFRFIFKRWGRVGLLIFIFML